MNTILSALELTAPPDAPVTWAPQVGQPVPGAGIPDAPADDDYYARRNNAWQPVGGGGGTPGADGKTIRNGAGAPAGGLGVDGDFYIDTTGDSIYGPKVAGAWGAPTSLVGPVGADGADGTPGADGAPGDDGADGAPGLDGSDGADGADGKTIRNGTGAPAGGLGVDGDFYIDTAADAIYGPKAAGAWGSATSLIGPAGADGSDGTDGADGAPGADGQGVSIQGSDTYANIVAIVGAAPGDLWIQTDSGGGGSPGDGLVYSGSSWNNIGPIRGPAGADGTDGADGDDGAPGSDGSDGKTVRNGTGAPAGGLGVDGDFYIDTAADAIYGPKAAGAWGSATSLIGAPGADGAPGDDGADGAPGLDGSDGSDGSDGADGKTIRNGTGAPAGGLGVDGDFYIDTAADAIYGPKAAGAWGSATSLIGPAGADGSDGADGDDGAPGAAGDDGADGAPGLDGSDGSDGADGKTVRNGTGAPAGGLGVDGDFYIDTAADAIYGPKVAGAWGSATSLVGPAGADGADGDDGTDGTNGTNGTDGADGVAAEVSMAELRWEATDFLNSTATTNQPFTGTAVSSGTSVTPLASGLAANHVGVTRLVSSTTANGGYRWQTTRELRGGAGIFTRAVVNWETTTNVTVRGGFHDSATSADAVDGAYWECNGATLSFKTANNSTRSTHGTTYTITPGVWYTIDVEYITDSDVQCTIRTDDGTIVYQQNLTTNIPTGTTRTFFAGVVATESTTTAINMLWLDNLGVGPKKPKWGGLKGDTGDDGPAGPSGVANVTVEDVSTTTYTLVLADAGKYKRTSNGSATAITVPPNSSEAFAVGDVVYFRQGAAGLLTLVQGSGVTINPPNGGTLVSVGAQSAMAITKVGTDEWDLVGQTAP